MNDVNDLLRCRRLLIGTILCDSELISEMSQNIINSKPIIPSYNTSSLYDLLDTLVDEYFDDMLELLIDSYYDQQTTSMEVYDISSGKSYIFDDIEQYAKLFYICNVFVFSQLFKSYYKLI